MTLREALSQWWAFFSCTKLGIHRWCGIKGED